MDLLLWLVPGFIAVGSGVLAYFVMQSRMDVALARERESMAAARGQLDAEKAAIGQALVAAREQTRREALDDFLADVRVEQRHYIREHRMLFNSRRALVMQERIFFRNLPLSNWIEHEVVLQQGEDAERVARLLSFFADVAGVDRPNFDTNPLLEPSLAPAAVLPARRIQ
jgi:hypothetical protein